jgi:hypothetical protein
VAVVIFSTGCQLAAEEPVYLVAPTGTTVDLSKPLPNKDAALPPREQVRPEPGQVNVQEDAREAIADEQARAAAALTHQADAVQALKSTLEETRAEAQEILEAVQEEAKTATTAGSP